MALVVQDQPFDKADQLWEYLSDIGSRKTESEVIYRGHADSAWRLVPTILRSEPARWLQELLSRSLKCEDLAWIEFQLLRFFILNCDEVGARVPNDSLVFRETHLTDRGIEKYYDEPSTWPCDDLIEPMAMARLHGLPTRLLDWSTHPYVAVYFAVREALRTRTDWRPGQRLAVIELRMEPSAQDLCGTVRLLRVRGSISENVVAQHGLFTLHPILGDKGDPFVTEALEQYLAPPPDASLAKLTLPVTECVRLFELCARFKFNAARLFPNADGASESVNELYRFTLAHRFARTA